MDRIVCTLKWACWKVAYLFRPEPETLFQWVLKATRTRAPWWKFEPYIWHNKDGRQWHITFTDERNHTQEGTLKCRIHVGIESGNIVGLTIYDETLKGV
jgi:hypothetical protein